MSDPRVEAALEACRTAIEVWRAALKRRDVAASDLFKAWGEVDEASWTCSLRQGELSVARMALPPDLGDAP